MHSGAPGELGHAGEVKLQAGRGEWFCAFAWARRSGAQGRQAEALETLAPYTALGWWRAAEATAKLLEEWGRTDAAVAMVRPYAGAGDWLALNFLGRLLSRHGRSHEAFGLLAPHIDEWFVADALVAVASVAGRDDEAARLLSACIEAGHPGCDDPSCNRRTVEPSNAVSLLAEIRERQSHVDEAIELLRTRNTTSVNNRDQLADLFARHGRVDELRTYAAEDYHGHAAQRLAELLEERGDLDGAIAVYQNPGDSAPRRFNGTVLLARLLQRHGRGDEAIEVMHALADSPGGGEDWIIHTLCTLYQEQGRAEDGLAYLDAIKGQDSELEWEFYRMRLPLLVACGRRDEAIEQARAHPEGNSWYAAGQIATLLAEAGRLEEAVVFLEENAPKATTQRAEYLIELGRVADAIALCQTLRPKPDHVTGSRSQIPMDATSMAPY